MLISKKSFSCVLAIMLARTSLSFVSGFTQNVARRSVAPAASSIVNRWMSEGDSPVAEKTEEEKAAIKAAREARK